MSGSSSAEEVLIVEDDDRLAELLREYLAELGFVVSVAARGDDAVARILEHPPRVVLLDIMLPGLDGMEVLRQVRDRYAGGIVMLTAKQGDAEEVLGLELGADDYVTKPVVPRTLLARIRSLLRRLEPPAPGAATSLVVGALELDRRRREASVRGERAPLTSTEFEILWTLAQTPGEVVTRDRLYRAVHNASYDGLDRGMDVHISRIRRKLEWVGLATSAIKSVRGSGYVLALA